jgi:hypothetical protein
MKIRFIFIIVMSLLLSPLSAKKYGTFYFSPAQEFTKRKYGIVKSVINSKTNYFYREDLFISDGKSWTKTLEYNTYNFINDSVLVIEKFQGTSLQSTTYRHFVKVDAFYYKFSDYTDTKLLLQRGFATHIMPLCKYGKVTHLYPDGSVRQEAEYERNRLVSNTRWRMNGDPDVDNVFEVNQVDKAPLFIGGDIQVYANQQANFPKEALKRHKKGVLNVRFIIMENGTLARLEVVNKTDPELDYEAYRVIFQTRSEWRPGLLNGKPVKVEMNVKIFYGTN